MRTGSPSRGGFTLIEVVIALVVGSVALLGARLLVTALAGVGERITTHASAADAEANGEALLRALVGRIEVGTKESEPFGGTPREAHFTTWCDVPEGWQERCNVTLAIEAADSMSVLVVTLPVEGRVVLKRGFRAAALRYLDDPAGGGQWFATWGTGITAPLGLGVILDRDTLIVRIGERG